MESLSDIAVFAQVVEAGSFTAAAQRLEISKSVVSKYVTRLENRLGARLLNRTTRRLSLTEIGIVFYERSRAGLEAIKEAEAEVSRLQGAPRGRIRVSAPMSFGILHLAPLVPAFLRLYPDVALDLQFDDRKIDIVDEGFDLAVRVAELPDSSLIARRLCPCRHVICAAPEYLERFGTPTTPEDLRHHNVISYRYQSSAHFWHFHHADEKPASVPVAGSLQMNNSLALREALLRGAGIARTPTFVVGDDIRNGRLQRLLEDYEIADIAVYALYPQRRHLSPNVRAFVNFLAENFSETPGWD